MSTFWGVFQYEYKMSVQRRGMWIAFIIFYVPFLTSMVTPENGWVEQVPLTEMWRYAGSLAVQMNILAPVVGGIAIADRLWRDGRLGVSELIQSTPLKRWTYILGKYTGGLLSALTPVLAYILAVDLIGVIFGMPFYFIPMTLVSFLAICLPAFAFITAFSLACPLVIPVRVYQVLFTGYWFWGNYLNPKVFPTLANTYLSPSGKFASEGFFDKSVSINLERAKYTPLDAVLNILMLIACIAIALIVLERFLAWRASRA